MVLFWAAMCTPNAVGSVADERRVVVGGQPEAGHGPLSHREPCVAFWIGSLGTLGLSLGLGRQVPHRPPPCFLCSEGSNLTPAHHFQDFRFKTYAPVAFRYFRELFGIRPDDYLVSVSSAAAASPAPRLQPRLAGSDHHLFVVSWSLWGRNVGAASPGSLLRL